MDDERKEFLLSKVRSASVSAGDVSRGNPSSSHLNVLADAVCTLAAAVRAVLEEI